MSSEVKSERVVLYADDDPDDRMLLSDTFHSVAPDVEFKAVPDGFKVFDFLQNPNERKPCLLILDLNMPGISGREVMQRLKADTEFRSLPIVVFTTSSNPADRNECARYGVDMLTKPMDLREFEHAANALLNYCH
jgi:CheY-like chemotaxis protein